MTFQIMRFHHSFISLFVILFIATQCSCKNSHSNGNDISTTSQTAILESDLSEFQKSLVNATKSIINPGIKYDPTYFNIPYPGGDVPDHLGVCTDVVIRAYRKIGVDLQKEVHIDMKKNFNLYPKKWGLKSPDKNIDHRRVPNLMTFFSRFGVTKPITNLPKDYVPGDIVCWELDNGLTHIGIVIDELNSDKSQYKVVHNIGQGQVPEDILFKYKIIGHYSYEKK